MAANIITLEDLQNFKQELLSELKKILSQRQTVPVRKWLKSHEVRRLLTLSPGTLQTLRINGTLPFTKIGGIIFYDYDDIQKMIEENKTNRDFPSRKNNPWRNV
jgi:AAA+ ATPase superfamily predicted ATPase